MDPRKITTGDMMHTYGCFGAGVDYTVRTTVRLSTHVDIGRLQRAIRMTAGRYPYFCVRLRNGETSYYYEDNPLPIKLSHTDDRIRLNSPETNHHVWSVCCNEDRIHLDFFHGITDETGIYTVLSTLLYYYGVECGTVKSPGNILTAEVPIGAGEVSDPLDAMGKDARNVNDMAEAEEAFSLKTDGNLTPAPATLWDIVIPEKEFIPFTSANDASPGTMVSLLLARAIDRLYPDRKKKIVSAYVINARPMLEAAPNSHNCLSMAFFPYSDRIKKLPFSTQCTVYRGMTILQSDKERVAALMTENARQIQSAKDGAKTLEEKKRVFGQMFNGGEGIVTFLVSYVGQWKYPAVADPIREIWIHPAPTFDLMAEMSAAGGNICLTIQQRFKEDSVREMFLKELDENGISYDLKQVIAADNAFFSEP